MKATRTILSLTFILIMGGFSYPFTVVYFNNPSRVQIIKDRTINRS